nr:hypothetical protein [Candidatus Sigynarchaeota archaeon]
MIQPKFLVAVIALANGLWGLIPLYVMPLFQLYPDAIFIMTFIRFAFSSGIIFALIFLQLILNGRRTKAGYTGTRLAFFQTSWKDLKIYLVTRNKAFHGARRLAYIFIVAMFGATVNVTTYFIGLNELSIIFMIVGAPGGSLILISLYDSIQGKERLTMFKLVYLCLMFVALILSFLAVQGEVVSNISASFVGLVAFLLNILSLFVLFTQIGKDSYDERERIWQKARSGNYRLMRALTKMAIYMAFGSASIIPIAIAGASLPLGYLSRVSFAFFEHMVLFFQIAGNPNIFALVIVCTVLPYVCIFVASSFWDTDSSFTYESWSSILSLVDPVLSTTTSVLAGLEHVDIVFFVLTLVVLFLAILLRFVHERESKINALIYIKVLHGHGKEVYKFLMGQQEIRRFATITGDADIVIWATFGSILQYNNFLSRISTRKEIKIKFDLLGFVRKTYT